MQATTMTDINDMQNNTKNNVATDQAPIDSLEKVVTAPQSQLEELDDTTPKQPIGNNQ